MGNLVSPVDPETSVPYWIPEAWFWWIAQEEGRSRPEPDWLNLPAMHAMVLAHPSDYRHVRRLNQRTGHDEGVKPFDTLLIPHLDRFMSRDGGPTMLIAPWESDSARWLELICMDPLTDWSLSMATVGVAGTRRAWERKPAAISVQSMRSYVEQHFTRPESASASAAGHPCHRETVGVLVSRTSSLARPTVVGKESSRLAEVRAGWSHTRDERQSFDVRRCLGCGAPLAGKQSDWCGTCRSLPGRERQRKKGLQRQ
jgi:hypothetical protein